MAWLGNIQHKGPGRPGAIDLSGRQPSPDLRLSTQVWLSCLMLFLSGAALIGVFAAW